nr:hypothetical protein [Tanacetum cinerariifolium]
MTDDLLSNDVQKDVVDRMYVYLTNQDDEMMSPLVLVPIDEQEATESGEGDDDETESDEESEDDETTEKEEESFNPIPRTPEESEDDGNAKEDQGVRISEEERMHEEEEADELYRMESIFTTGSSSVTPTPSPKSTMTPSIITTTTTASQPPIPPTAIPSDILQTLLTFASIFHFEDRVKSLEVNFLEFMRTNQSPEAVSNIPDRLQDSIQRDNDEFLRTIDDNMKKIIKEKVKSQVKAQVTRILPRIEESVNTQLEAEEGPSAGSDRGSKRQREGGEHASASTPSEPTTRSAGRSTTGTQSRQMSASVEDPPIVQTSQHPEWFSQPRKPPTPDRDWNKTLPAVQGNAQSWISALAKQTDARSSFNKLLDTPIDFSNFIMNRLGVDTLTPELLAGPTYELMRGSCNSLTELEYHLEEVYKVTTDQLDWDNPEGTSSRKYTTSVTKTKAADYGHIKWIKDLFHGFAVNRESALDVYSKRRIIAVTDLKIVEWHNYKHLDWISVRRDDDKIYKFKIGDFKRLCLQDIKDMLLLLVQGKLFNLTVEERFAFNVSLRMFTRSIVIQRRVEDLQLGGTLKGKWRYLIPAILPIHYYVLIPNYQDFKIQDFRYSDGFECFQAIKIGMYEHESPMSLKHKMDEITK